MVNYTKREIEHATRYAHEATKLYLMDYYLKKYPQIFQFASIKQRFATEKDYHIPPQLDPDKCVVITRTSFDRNGCERVACFPFKDGLEACEKEDPARWVPFGKGYTLACQPSCREPSSVDTEWRRGTCYQSNTYKKILAMLPEQIFNQTTRHPLHQGLDLIDGHLRLNRMYCEAYGLKFDGNDCFRNTGQAFLEIILGQTVYRSLILPKASVAAREPPPSHVPIYAQTPPSRKKRHVPAAQSNHQNAAGEPPASETNALATDIAQELAVDFGMDLGFWLVEKILKEKVPKLILKASTDAVYKSAVTQAVIQSYAQFSIQTLKMVGIGVSAVSGVLSAYGIVSLVLDLLDPYHFNRVIDAKTLKTIDRQFDLKFFQKENEVHREVTPELVWNYVLNEGDESHRYEYMAERMQEYLTALYNDPDAHADDSELPPLVDVEFQNRQMEAHWNGSIQVAILVMLVTLAVMSWQWIHVWTTLAFFLMLYFARYSD